MLPFSSLAAADCCFAVIFVVFGSGGLLFCRRICFCRHLIGVLLLFLLSLAPADCCSVVFFVFVVV